MSCNYAENLSPYENKGKLGLPEVFDSEAEVTEKCEKLAKLLKSSSHTVIHTGAGISTSAGIPDFRGPKGVWTLEKEGKKPAVSVSWNDAKPTFTHMALLALQRAGLVSYIITQNIDGLHLRSGLPRSHLAELHGNMFTDKCGTCHRQFVRHEAAATVGLKSQGVPCPGRKAKSGRRCRGKLHDTILDWEDSLPEDDLELGHLHSCCADLSLCLGTSLQIVPSGNLPLLTKKRGGNLVICNLQPTKQDKHADLLIHSYVDDVMSRVLRLLDIVVPEYDRDLDPVLRTGLDLARFSYDPLRSSLVPDGFEPVEWTVVEWVKERELVRRARSRKVVVIKRRSSTGRRDAAQDEDVGDGGKRARQEEGKNEENGEQETKTKEEKVKKETKTKEAKVKQERKMKDKKVKQETEMNEEKMKQEARKMNEEKVKEEGTSTNEVKVKQEGTKTSDEQVRLKVEEEGEDVKVVKPSQVKEASRGEGESKNEEYESQMENGDVELRSPEERANLHEQNGSSKLWENGN